ncbi:MAG: sodium:calcium antiporter [Lysobacterales bacterium]
MWEVFGLFVLGLGLLTLGADSLVKGASGLAQHFGAGAAAAGMAMVAVGSSLPELAISATAILQGHYALAMGNVIGSCIANFGLIIAVAALVKPLNVNFRLVSFALPLLIVVSLMELLMSLNGKLGYDDGTVLLAGVALFGWQVRKTIHCETEAVCKELSYAANTQTDRWRNISRIVFGAVLLGYGAWLASKHAYELSVAWHMSELLAGLTLLAVGSAIPELATAIVSAARGHGNVVVGSAVASSTVNLMLVLGLLALWHPLPIPRSLVWIEYPALIAFAAAFYPMLRGDAQVSRREGGILLGAFAAWIGYQVMLA